MHIYNQNHDNNMKITQNYIHELKWHKSPSVTVRAQVFMVEVLSMTRKCTRSRKSVKHMFLWQRGLTNVEECAWATSRRFSKVAFNKIKHLRLLRRELEHFRELMNHSFHEFGDLKWKIMRSIEGEKFKWSQILEGVVVAKTLVNSLGTPQFLFLGLTLCTRSSLLDVLSYFLDHIVFLILVKDHVPPIPFIGLIHIYKTS